MAKYVVLGTGGFEVAAIREEILSSKDSAAIQERIFDVLTSLGIDSITMQREKTACRSGIDLKTPLDVFSFYMSKWKLKHSREATLDKLCTAFEKHELNAFSERLMEIFGPQEGPSNSPSVTEVDNKAMRTAGEDVTPTQEFHVMDCPSFGRISRFLKKLGFTEDLPKDFVDPKVLRPSKKMTAKEDKYCLPTGFKGLFLLVNILKYKDNDNRKGAAIDTRRLGVVFESLGYEVVLYTGTERTFTRAMFAEILDAFKERCTILEVKSFGVFLGGHGREGKLELSDGTLVDLECEVFSELCTPPEGYRTESTGSTKSTKGDSPYWAEIPKMFFIQACRSAVKDAVEKRDNYLISYACGAGKLAWRSPTDGSYYVKALTQTLAESAKDQDLETMLEKVSWRVKTRCEDQGKKGDDVQTPEVPKECEGKFGKLYFNMLPDKCLRQNPR